jgi:hypothetical protein
MNVEYRAIPGYTGYRAGSDGSIWSCRKLVGSQWYGDMRTEAIGEWKQLKPSKRKEDGRVRYTLRHDSGLYDRRYGSHFVLLAFVGECPDGMEACHENGDCLDDSKSNLRWDTSTNNKADMVKHGTQPRGEKHCCAKVTDAEAQEIIERRLAGETLTEIAYDYDLSISSVSWIAKGKRKNAPGD